MGTQHLLSAAAAPGSGVSRFVYTSSASVVFDGTDLIRVDEATAPEPAVLLDYYTTTKRDAERLVLKARSWLMEEKAFCHSERLSFPLALRPRSSFPLLSIAGCRRMGLGGCRPSRCGRRAFSARVTPSLCPLSLSR